MDYHDRFRVTPGTTVDLRCLDATQTASRSEREARDEIAANADKLRKLQDTLYAENRRSLLIVLQAMDAGGKDGIVRHVFASMNPQGVSVHAFKQPTPQEAAHDFLWRVHAVTPARGRIAIFNRSHYEDVLVARVHGLVPEKVWSLRYDRINEFEKTLAQNDTHVLKFFLHITPEEQLERFKARLDDPRKQWKISEDDYVERTSWDAYMAAYEEVFRRCSTDDAPWFVIPANHKWFRNLAVSSIVVETLEALKLHYPLPTVDLAEIGRRYHAAAETPIA
jgi:PPK2 family polyphosphate:nucleotide phosphotransferase